MCQKGGFGTEVHVQGGKKLTATPVAWIVGASKSSELVLNIEIRTVENSYTYDGEFK